MFQYFRFIFVLKNNLPQNGISLSQPFADSHFNVFDPKISYPASHSYVASENSLFGPAFNWTRELDGTAGGPQTVNSEKRTKIKMKLRKSHKKNLIY